MIAHPAIDPNQAAAEDINVCPPCPPGIPQNLWEQEHQRELQSLSDGVERFMEYLSRSAAQGEQSQTGPHSGLLARMVEPVADAIDKWMEEAKSGKPGPRHEVLPLLLALPSTKVAAYLACKAVVDELTIETRTANRVAFHIAERLETEVRIKAMLFQEDKDNRKKSKALLEKLQKQGRSYAYLRQLMIAAANKGLCKHLPKWGMRNKAVIGGMLLQFIVDVTGVIEFQEEYTSQKISKKLIVPTRHTMDWIAKRIELTRESKPYYAPLVCPPRPWDNPYEGGYWHLPTPLIRKGKPAYLEELANDPKMDDIYKAVNALQNTAWNINPVIFDVFSNLWDSQDYEESLMVKAKDTCIPRYDQEGKSESELRDMRQKIGQVVGKNKSDFGKRKALLMTRDSAKEFLGNKLWFAYNLDFRGRIYPVSTHLTPQGDDLQRGLLQFASSKLVETQEQIDCLAIHGANTWGNKVDKMSYADRIAWVTANEDMIIQAASNPLGYRKWMLADDPWQFLAFCLEWTTYLGEGLGVFRTNLPVAVDGTCSGLQHFSAILRDEVGAQATNLTPGPSPSDIYGIVAERTLARIKMIDEETARGWLKFGFDRSGAKRPVMTLPYGATQYSAREYLQDWLDEKMAAGKASTFPCTAFGAAHWLTPHLWGAIGETVAKAREAMDWLHKVARIVAKSGNPIWWTSPSGFQVFQGYPNTKQRRVDTSLQGKKVVVSYREETKGYDAAKAASGLAPNFVHSMDAAALTLTVIGCLDEGIDAFGMIHDSFACHCTDMPKMAQILRKAFVDMYTTHDVLAEFEKSVKEVLPEGTELPPRPASGNLDINLVLKSPYFFS